MKRVIIVLTITLLNQWAFSQQQQTLTNWEFYKQELGGVWEVWRNQRHEQKLWKEVKLPHCFNSYDALDPDIQYYQGEGWYKTFVPIDNPYKNGRTILHFEGAGQKTTLWLYDKKIGTHIGGYDEFSFDITNELKNLEIDTSWQEKIPIAVCADNSRDLEMIPSDLSDFFIYGGLYRKVHLKYEPQVYIERTHVTSELSSDSKTANISVKTLIQNPDNLNENATASINIFTPTGKLVASTKIVFNTSDSINISELSIKNPVLWSPNTPNLYTCKVTLKLRDIETSFTDIFGIRSFSFAEKGPFYLNGERLLLRGVHRHEDHAGTGAAMSDNDIRKEMKMIKDLGANFIRLGHYQQSELVLDLCDSLGILVWEEIPWCRGGLGGERYKSQARNMLKAMVTQHYNHPSVILWGLGNENDWPGDFETFDKEEIRSFMKELNAIAHQLDNTRKTCIRRCAFCADIVDVYSPSIWAGWYRGKYTDYKNVSENERRKYDRFFHAEWGASQHPLRFSTTPDEGLKDVASSRSADERAGDYLLTGGIARVSRDGDWSESYACNLIDWHLKEQLTMDSLTGAAYWPFKDFGTPLRPNNPIPYLNQKGIVQRDFTPKESYYVFQSYWTEKPMVHIHGHTWTTRWGDSNEKQLVKIYSNCEKVELFVNGISYGTRTRNPQDFPAAGLRWFVPFIEGENAIKAVAYSNSSQPSDKIKIEYQIEKWEVPSQFKTEIIEQSNDTALIKTVILDKNQTHCLDAKNTIRFGIAGDGELIDNLGTVKNSRVIQMSNGTAYIHVKMNNGKSILSISSEDIDTDFITIE